jgi:hypothetical protein
MSNPYRIPVLEQYEFQPAILDKDLSTPPISPVKGDRYIVGGGAVGDWAGKDKNIAWYDGAIWKFDAPKVGTLTYVVDENKFYQYNGSAWVILFEELGLGDMLKSTYDVNANNIVDKAESIDDGAGNTASAVDLKDAVTKKHSNSLDHAAHSDDQDLTGLVHSNREVLDAMEVAFTTALKTAYDGAVTDKHTHSNKTILDAIEVALTTTLKGNYDTAYSSRAVYDVELGCITFNL